MLRKQGRDVLEAGECGKERKEPAGNTVRIPVAMRLGETPVLIPNTMVKT